MTAASHDSSDEVVALKRDVASLKRAAIVQAGRAAGTALAVPAAQPPQRPTAPSRDPELHRKLVTDALEGRLSSESGDPGWSGPRVREIKSAFAASLPGVNVVAADCATTLCKVVVEHTDGESQESLTEKAAETEGLDGETYFLFDRDASPPRTTLYMGRSGHHLPHPPS